MYEIQKLELHGWVSHYKIETYSQVHAKMNELIKNPNETWRMILILG